MHQRTGLFHGSFHVSSTFMEACSNNGPGIASPDPGIGGAVATDGLDEEAE